MGKRPIPSENDIRNSLIRNPKQFIKDHITMTGHAFTSHVNVTDANLLNDVLSSKKQANTRFFSEELAYEQIGDTISDCAKDISKFLATAEDGETHEFQGDASINFDETPRMIGVGFTSTARDREKNILDGNVIRMIQTNTCSVVIRKNDRQPDGWQIESAYPSAHPRTKENAGAVSRVVKIDYSDTMKKTPAYAKLCPVEKTYVDLTCTGQNNNKLNEDIFMVLRKDASPATRRFGPRLVLYDAKIPGTHCEFRPGQTEGCIGTVVRRTESGIERHPFSSPEQCFSIVESKSLQQAMTTITTALQPHLPNPQRITRQQSITKQSSAAKQQTTETQRPKTEERQKTGPPRQSQTRTPSRAKSQYRQSTRRPNIYIQKQYAMEQTQDTSDYSFSY